MRVFGLPAFCGSVIISAWVFLCYYILQLQFMDTSVCDSSFFASLGWLTGLYYYHGFFFCV